MKIIKIVRTGGLRSNEITQESFDFKETNKFFVILRPNENSNKNLEKGAIMNPKAEISIGGTHLFAMIWCYDYQESEAKEKLEEAIELATEREKMSLEKQLANLEMLKARLKTEKRIIY